VLVIGTGVNEEGAAEGVATETTTAHHSFRNGTALASGFRELAVNENDL